MTGPAPSLPLATRLLIELEQGNVRTDHLIQRLKANPDSVRTRLNELREIGVVTVVATVPGARTAPINVWGLSLAEQQKAA